MFRHVLLSNSNNENHSLEVAQSKSNVFYSYCKMYIDLPFASSSLSHGLMMSMELCSSSSSSQQKPLDQEGPGRPRPGYASPISLCMVKDFLLRCSVYRADTLLSVDTLVVFLQPVLERRVPSLYVCTHRFLGWIGFEKSLNWHCIRLDSLHL